MSCFGVCSPKIETFIHAHTVHVVSKADPNKYILARPVLSDRLAKWEVLLKQYDLLITSQKATKGWALTYFFANHPVPSKWELSIDLPREEIFYVNILMPNVL